MDKEHPNISLIKRLNPMNLAACKEQFAADIVWHYFNPLLPDIQGDYVGLAGLESFFEALDAITKGTFHVKPISMLPVGDELVMMQTRNTMTLEAQKIVTDVALVWRIVDGRIKEVWDIPSVYTKPL